MTITQQGIIALVKSAILEKTVPLPDEFHIEDAAQQIKRHQIATLAYAGAVYCGISRKNTYMQQLFYQYCKMIQISERQMQELNCLYTVFEENGIDYMPLKGSRMKPLYPKPELRVMGDADILIRMEQYEKIRQVMDTLRFVEKGETDHELVWQSDRLYLELHKRLVPSYNKDFYAYFDDGWKLAGSCSGTQYAMTAENEFIYLFTHFAKHYRDGGIGCRHVVDLWVYIRSNPNLNQAYIQDELRKLQLLEFYQNMCRLIAVWFDEEMSDTRTDFITEYIFASGSWGEMESRVLSRAVRDSRNSTLRFSGRLSYLWKTAFPNVEMLQGKYIILKKNPHLLPAVWVIRPFYKAIFERESLKQLKRNFEVISQEGMENQQQMLNYVGLDFHF